MARPQLGNSNVRRQKSIGLTEKVTASAWLNIEDPELEAKVVEYYRSTRNNPSVQLQVDNGVGQEPRFETVATVSLFYNDDKPKQQESNNEPKPF
tara:strand:- start:238 stop:522 length:285 start_codon:yes stop_codon:yes gene_type:complete